MRKANFFGKKNILSSYEEIAETPFFSIWSDKSKMLQNYENDENVAFNKLEKYIDRCVDSGNTAFTICIHPEAKKSYVWNDWKEAVLMYCDCNEVPVYTAVSGSTSEIVQAINSLRSDINALRKEDIEEEEEEESLSGTDKQAAMLSEINGIINSPVATFLMGLFTPAPQQITKLAGIETEIESYINTLFSKGVTADHLKKLSEMPKEKISMLIQML
jgi:hypothetical protein